MTKNYGNHFKIRYYYNLDKNVLAGFRFQNQYKKQIHKFAKEDI